MRIVWLPILLISIVFTALPARAQEQTDLAKALVGRWEGEFQKEAHDKFDTKRALIIGGVEQQGEKWILKNVKYAIPGNGAPVDATLEVKDGVPTIEFKTSAGNPVKLSLEKDGDLVGMTSLRGVHQNSTPVRPMRLKKVSG